MNRLLDFDPLADKKIRFYLVGLLIILTIFLRVYKISSIPSSLEQDETAIGYNAYSILETGKDEWGQKYPLYFKSFGDYKLPAYIYTTALFVKVLGLNEYAVRLPSAIAGIFAVGLLFFLVRYLTKNFTLALIAGLLLAINPMHLQFSRTAFEVNFALTAALAGVTLFCVGTDKKRLWMIFLSLLFFAISLYSYNTTRLLSPVLLVGSIILYQDKLKKFGASKLLSALFFLFVLLLPFLLSFLSSAGVMSAKSSLITGTDVTAKNVEMRSYLLSLPSVFLKIFYNKYVYMIFQYFQNLANGISGSFYFVSGSSHPNQGIGNVGVFYLFELPLFIAGLVLFLKEKIKSYQFFGFWLLISYLTLALSKEVPHATRGYFLVLPVITFSALGLLYFVRFIVHYKKKYIKYASIALVSLFVFYNLQFYFASYYFRQPYVNASSWQIGNKTLAAYLRKVESKYDKIIINEKVDVAYISLLFYNQYPPEQFIQTATRHEDRLLHMAKSWGKYEYRGIDWKKDSTIPNALIITNEQNWPNGLPVKDYLYYPTQQIVLSVNDQLVQYPKTDIAFVMVDTNMIQVEE